MTINNKFNLGDYVYITTDVEQKKHIITEIKIQPGCLIYQLSYKYESNFFHEIEISKEEDLLLKLKN